MKVVIFAGQYVRASQKRRLSVRSRWPSSRCPASCFVAEEGPSVADLMVCSASQISLYAASYTAKSLPLGSSTLLVSGNHRMNQSGVVDNRFDAVLTRFAFDIAVRLAVCAHVGEVVDEEGFACRRWDDDRDLPALAVLKTQDEIAVMGNLRRDTLRSERARGDVVHGHQPFAAAGDGV